MKQETKLYRHIIYDTLEKTLGKFPVGFKGVLSKMLKEYSKLHHNYLVKTNTELLEAITEKNVLIEQLRKELSIEKSKSKKPIIRDLILE